MWPLLPAALAAGLDADGLSIPPADGSSGQSPLVATSPTTPARNVAIGLQTALSVRPLVRRGGTEEPLVSGAGTAYLQAVGMGTSWLGAELHVPIRYVTVGGAAALGDASAHVVIRPLERQDLGLTLRLGTSAPLGSTTRFSGAGVWVPRGAVAARFGRALRADLALGAAWEGPVVVQPDLVRGGPTLDAGAGVGLERSRFGVGVGARLGLPLAQPVRQRRGIGIEVAAQGTVQLASRLQLRVLASRALSSAAGFPDWRIGGGATWRLGPQGEVDDPVDAAPVAFTVRSPDGLPVAGARVQLAEGEVRTDAAGQFHHPTGDWMATVRARGLQDGQLDGSTREVVLAWAPTPVRVEVTSERGEAVQARIDGVVLRPDGPRDFVGELAPGTHVIRVFAEGYGSQERVVEVAPRRVDPLVFEVVLVEQKGEAQLEMRIEDPQGRGIEAAEIRLDGVAVGTSATGTLKVQGLKEGAVKVEVESPYFGDFAAEVDLSGGAGFLTVDPYYAPGTVRVVAVGPDGPVRDGTVFVEGPRPLAPLELSPLGERLIRLGEGTWDVLLSSPALGLQERRLGIDRRSPVPVDVYFELHPEGEGPAELEVQITDRDGRPLPDVALSIDGRSVGTSSTDGTLRLHGLRIGASTLHASGPSLRPATLTVSLAEGLQQARLRMDWEPGTVRVGARDAAGPVDALATFAGPAPYEGGNLGPGGRRIFPEVPTGEWEVVASHEGGMEVALTLIEDDDPHLVDLFLQLGQEDGDATLDLTVVDPNGAPVEGAVVELDGVALAATSSGGGIRARGLRAGRRRVTVRSPLHGSLEQGLDLPGSSRVELPWRAGVVDLVVTRAGAPLGDATVFFDGPRVVRARPVGADGHLAVALGAGRWTAVVSSPSAGLFERSIELDEAPGPPRTVAIDVVPNTQLLVRVRDARGAPVAGVEVLADGIAVGRTGTGGTLGISRTGAVQVQLRDPRLHSTPARRVEVERTEQLFEVAFVAREVQVRVQAAGTPTAAWIQAIGPETVEPVFLGTAGEGVIDLPPGTWDLTASAEQLGVARRRVRVPAKGDVAPVVFDLKDAHLTLEEQTLRLDAVLFETGAYAIAPGELEVIEEIAATVLANPAILLLEVQGHTDATGSAAYNFELSRRRAEAVVQALVDRGVPPDMVKPRGFGPSRPIASNEDEAGRARNRRVHFEITREDDARGDR